MDGVPALSLGPRDLGALRQDVAGGGIPLPSVLKRANVGEFSAVTIVGRNGQQETTATVAGEAVASSALTVRPDGTIELVGASGRVGNIIRIDVQGAKSAGTGTSYAVIVVFKGKTVASFGFADLQALPRTGVEGQEGPTLLSVLDNAGIKEFSKVTVKGMGPGRTGPAKAELSRDQLSKSLILDFTKQGTVKLAGDSLPRESWVIDVTQIVVDD